LLGCLLLLLVPYHRIASHRITAGEGVVIVAVIVFSVAAVLPPKILLLLLRLLLLSIGTGRLIPLCPYVLPFFISISSYSTTIFELKQ